MRKVALVTGGSRGIGAATSMLLARNGFDVCINYKNNSAKAEQLLTQLRIYNSNSIAIQADISDEEQVVALFNQIDIQLGTIGVLVNNAGILKKQAPITELSAERINDILTNKIKIRAMNFMRGRTFLSRFVIIDEAQNLTPKQIKTLITRAGPDSKIVCLGNLAQIDTPYLTETSSGITYVVDHFKNWSHSGHITLTIGERSRLADYASEIL